MSKTDDEIGWRRKKFVPIEDYYAKEYPTDTQSLYDYDYIVSGDNTIYNSLFSKLKHEKAEEGTNGDLLAIE